MDTRGSERSIVLQPRFWPSFRRPIVAFISFAFLLSTALSGCRQLSSEPVTLTFLDPEWSHDARERSLLSDEALQEFTRQTGIRVKHLPGPETSPAQLALTRNLLERKAVTPDVYGIDVIWPGMLDEYLVDLKPYFAPTLSSENPEVLANYTVHDKLVAVPYHADTGILFYRTDLLQKYGYTGPPKTWDELEKMAARIQEEERARGLKDFWGFVWPGAASEGLTCNALEWQFDEGGGRIIETNGKISVNNPNAIRAWERAAHWVGWISPPGVVSYQEWDSINAFLNSGRAVFLRTWTSDYFLSHPLDLPIQERVGETSVPGGRFARSSALGGFGLAVSRSSAHIPEAIKLVQFLLLKETELRANQARSSLPKHPELFEMPVILNVNAPGEKSAAAKVLVRPSSVTGEKYDAVAQAYIQAVHSVLTGKSKADEAAANLEKQLVSITGFETGAPAGN